MTTLSKGLLAVLDSLPPTASGAGDVAAYKQAIQKNAATLDGDSVSVGATAQERATIACKVSQVVFGTKTITPENPGYKAEEDVPWSQTCWLPSACFINVNSACDVALALKIVSTTQSKFVVRGAGHNANPGYSSVGNDGLVIDVANINAVTLNGAKDTASLSPGAKWAKVYETLEKDHLTVAGGRVNDVGVGGLLLGGGMSHFSNEWGTAADNIKNFEVVLGDSRVVNVNRNENADLFKALKGGGSNFGIVTRFDVNVFPTYKLWYTVKVYAPNETEAIMKAAVEVQDKMPKDHKIGFFLSVQAQALSAGMLYHDWNVPKDVFAPFDKFTPLMTVVPPTNGTMASCSQALAIGLDAPGKREVGTADIKPSVKLYTKLYDVIAGIKTDLSLAFTYQPFGADAVNAGNAKGGNVMGIPQVDQSWIGAVVQWTDDTSDQVALNQMKDLLKKIHDTAKADNALLDFHFMNDASRTQDVLAGYGSGNVAYMRSMSQKYDPGKVFQKLQNDGFLLSRTGSA